MKRLLAFVLTLACALTLLSGCGQNTASGGDADTFTFLSWIKSESFDPTSGVTFDKSVTHALYDTLVAFGPDGEIEPMLAERWEESEDGMAVTFYLRQDVTFHNGDPLTADDVIYTFDTMLAQPMQYALLNYIGGYEKVDDYTVRFQKTAPYSKLMNVMAESSTILPKDYHSADPEKFDDAPVGCGPYKFVSQEADDSVRLTAYEGYYGDAPGFANVVVKMPLEPASAVIALETGDVDLTSNLPTSQALLVESNDKLTLVTEESWSTQILLLMQEPLKSDVNLRKAIFHGISRENAIKLGNEGVGTPSEDLFALRIMGDYAGIVEDFVGYDETLAREYLEASDYTGETLKLTINANAPIAESIQADLAKIGINVELEQLDTNSWATKLRGGELQMTLGAMGTDMLAAEDIMEFFTSDDPNYGVFMANNEQFDQLLSQMPSETDAEARRELVAQAMEILYDMANIVPLYDTTFNYSCGPRVTYDYPVSAPTYVYYLAKVMPAAAE